MARWDGESNEGTYERCGMEACASGVKWQVIEWVKKSTLRWFGHIGRMESKEFLKSIFE